MFRAGRVRSRCASPARAGGPCGYNAVAARTRLEQLVNGCGEHQPWVGVDSDQLEEWQRAVDADIAVLDASGADSFANGARTNDFVDSVLNQYH